MKPIQAVIIVTLITILSGCISAHDFVSVESKLGNSRDASGLYTVARGDTLYTIAFRYGLDYRQLASANSISPPYTIYPGQKIDLAANAKSTSAPKNTAVASAKKTSKPLPAANQTQSASSIPSSTAPSDLNDNAQIGWIWPANGRLISQFSTKAPVNKGVDISGALGESVLASAAGTVVYAGQGLRGYGNLVIVKHDDTFLSAYAHASRILVNEQDVVKAGQKIAEIGSTGTDKVKLHFEIRQNGMPVNPLQYLPAKSG